MPDVLPLPHDLAGRLDRLHAFRQTVAGVPVDRADLLHDALRLGLALLEERAGLKVGSVALLPRERLRAWRRRQGMTRRTAAALAGCTQPAWSHWEAGHRKPDYRFRLRLEELAGIRRDEW